MLETSVTIQVFADDDYHYSVTALDAELSVGYTENNGRTVTLTFGSFEEVEAVAKAMLQVIALRRQQH